MTNSEKTGYKKRGRKAYGSVVKQTDPSIAYVSN
jgi:hypothetical protein